MDHKRTKELVGTLPLHMAPVLLMVNLTYWSLLSVFNMTIVLADTLACYSCYRT